VNTNFLKLFGVTRGKGKRPTFKEW